MSFKSQITKAFGFTPELYLATALQTILYLEEQGELAKSSRSKCWSLLTGPDNVKPVQLKAAAKVATAAAVAKLEEEDKALLAKHPYTQATADKKEAAAVRKLERDAKKKAAAEEKATKTLARDVKKQAAAEAKAAVVERKTAREAKKKAAAEEKTEKALARDAKKQAAAEAKAAKAEAKAPSRARSVPPTGGPLLLPTEEEEDDDDFTWTHPEDAKEVKEAIRWLKDTASSDN